MRSGNCTPLFTLEHSKTAHRLDFAFLAGTAAGLGALLLFAGPRTGSIESALWMASGLAGWTCLEYGLHRFVLHGLRPFSTWHEEHHRRPAASIYSPAFVSIIAIAAFVYWPAWLIVGPWPACALTFGVVAGDLAYSVTHHAVHHWSARDGWLGRRKRWHGLHHAWVPDFAGAPGNYGVTSPFWDYVFRTRLERAGIGGARPKQLYRTSAPP